MKYIDINLAIASLTLLVSIMTLIITYISYTQSNNIIKRINRLNFDVVITKSSEFEYTAPIQYCNAVKSTSNYIDGDIAEVFLENNRYYCFNIGKNISLKELKEIEYLIMCSRLYDKIFYTNRYKKYKKKLIKESKNKNS